MTINVDRVLFPSDFSQCAAHALSHAVRFARYFNAELHFLHVAVSDQDRLTAEAKMAEVEDLVAEIMEQDGHPETLPLVKALESGSHVTEVIFRYTEIHGVDLIVMGTHWRRGLVHYLMGSVAEHVIRDAPCSVITVRHTEDRPAHADIENILVPVDFRPESESSVNFGPQLAGVHKAKLTFLHVLEKSLAEDMGSGDILTKGEHVRQKLSRLQSKMERLADRWHREVAVDYHLVPGPDVAAQITKFAHENEMDLIVLSSGGLKGLSRYLLGGVAAKVVRQSSCPVMVLNRQHFASHLLVDEQALT